MASWKEDSDRLRQRIKEGGGTTLVYVLLSHMRGKLHMRWYNKYGGGWRSGRFENSDDPIPPEIAKAYTGMERFFYERCAIRNLEDQAAWIRQYVTREWEEIAERVLSDSSPRSETKVRADLRLDL